MYNKNILASVMNNRSSFKNIYSFLTQYSLTMSFPPFTALSPLHVLCSPVTLTSLYLVSPEKKHHPNMEQRNKKKKRYKFSHQTEERSLQLMFKIVITTSLLKKVC